MAGRDSGGSGLAASGNSSSVVTAAPRRSGVVSRWLLWLGLALLAGLWLGPLPGMARTAFSPHMILHLGVGVVAAPLIALGLLGAGRGVRLPRRPLLMAAAASGIEMLIVWGWHAPVLHEAAARYDFMFAVQQITFLMAGMLVWMASFSGGSRMADGIGALAMLMTFAHMAMLGVLLSVAPELIYSPFVCQGAFGLDPLQDQRLGGALMGVAGSTPYFLGGMVLAYRFIAE